MKGYDGMLFAFEDPVKASFWMKDVQFPLDILFLDSQREVIEEHLNEQPCVEECPLIISDEENVVYVVEVKSGDAKKYKLEKGNELRW